MYYRTKTTVAEIVLTNDCCRSSRDLTHTHQAQTHTHRSTTIHVCKQTVKWANEPTDMQTDKQTNRQVNTPNDKKHMLCAMHRWFIFIFISGFSVSGVCVCAYASY